MFYTQKLFPNLFTLNLLLSRYPTPLNISYFWNFGSLAGIFLFIQVCTGLFLSFWYIPEALSAYNSVNFISQEVVLGFFIRFIHSNGASFFFLIVYLHIARALVFNSFVFPREKVWYSGMILFLLMIVTAFLGYVLPWGQMSYWAATVISTLVSTIPVVGENLLIFLWGGINIDQPTITRIYGLHFFLPFVLIFFAIIHIFFLHETGSSNPINTGTFTDWVPFNPYFTWKDICGLNLYFFLFYTIIFFSPLVLGHSDNFIPGDALVTPTHIVPEWYFLPFYGILRSIPSKIGGVIVLFLAISLFFLLPVFHETTLKNIRFRPLFGRFIFSFFINWVFLGWSGGQLIESPYFIICQITTYFFFLIILIVIPYLELLEVFLFKKLLVPKKNEL